jgi:hypothetical protein
VNFGEAKTELADWMGAANTKRLPAPVRGRLINEARQDLCQRDLRWNEREDTLTTVAGQRNYLLPLGWSRPYQCWYQHPDTGGRVDVNHLTREEFDRKIVDATELAWPSLYTIWGRDMLLGPTPDRVLTIQRTYYVILSALTEDEDATDVLLNHVWELVRLKALVAASAYMVEDARLPTWKAMAMEQEAKLVVEHSRGRSTGRRAQSREPS